MNKNFLPSVLWLWIPVFAAVVQFFIECNVPKEIVSLMHSENGPHELLQFLIICMAAGTAITILYRFMNQLSWALRLWMLLTIASCLYVAGEEVSWGQHFFAWGTPEYWLSMNDQQETNLHNTSSWLDQKPRLLLEIAVIFGGLLMPLITKFKPSFLQTKFKEIYPPATLWIIALCAELPKYIEKINNQFGIDFFGRESEIQELFFFYFVFLYLINFYCQQRQKESEG